MAGGPAVQNGKSTYHSNAAPRSMAIRSDLPDFITDALPIKYVQSINIEDNKRKI